MKIAHIVFCFCLSPLSLLGQPDMTSSGTSVAGSAAEPIRYVGAPKLTDQQYHDGQLRPAIGVHSYQILRANPTNPTEDDRAGNCYNHAPMIAYWNDTYFVEYIGSKWSEHGEPTQTYLLTSKDGIQWGTPRLLFPAIQYAPGKVTIAHQRMGFYVAPNGRLLVMAFYGIPKGVNHSPNTGFGIGRAIREIYKDQSLGPIYFIRAMPHAGYDEKKVSAFYPMYRTSTDAGFVSACESLLKNKLMTQQWWEEDRGKDGFFSLDDSTPGFSAKALSFYTRKDGQTVGLWKDAYAALSPDKGATWTTPKQIKTKPTSTAKEWGQRTDDGRYAITYNPMPKTFFRFPLAVITSPDGITYDTMLAVQTEVPVLRNSGNYKDRGQNYVRGIAEGNGNPPGNAMPVIYSMNKEDLWVSYVPAPITAKTTQPVNDTFDRADALNQWNIYAPQWGTVTRDKAENDNWVLKLTDSEPHDYAKAVRVIPETTKGTLTFKLKLADMKGGRVEFDVLDAAGNRAIRLGFDGAFGLNDVWNGVQSVRYPHKRTLWYTIELTFDTAKQQFSMVVDGKPIVENGSFYQKVASLERLEFRTGAYRREAQYEHIHEVDYEGPFFVRGDQKRTECVVYIDDVQVK